MGTAWILPVGAEEWTTRWVDCSSLDETKSKLYLAVHGAAFAFSTEPLDIEHGGSAEVSWEEENEDEDRSFESPPGVFMGPIAFQNERVIFAAYNVEGQVNVLRYVRNGRFARIARFGLDEDWTGDPRDGDRDSRGTTTGARCGRRRPSSGSSGWRSRARSPRAEARDGP